MAADVPFLNSALLSWVLSQMPCLFRKSLFLGQKESSRLSIMYSYSLFHPCAGKKMGPVLLQVGRSCLDIQNWVQKSIFKACREMDDWVPKNTVS